MRGETPKRPREWAAEIAALPTLEGRRKALAQVPDALLPVVETHLRNTWAIKKNKAGR